MILPYSIRVLEPIHLAEMRQLLHLFGRAFEEPEKYSERLPSDEYLTGLFEKNCFVAIVALRDDVVLGGLAGYVLKKFEQDRSEFYIYDLAVEEAHRRQGIANALLQKLKEISAERGIYGIYVQAELGDDPAIALYAKHGKRAEVLHFDIAPSISDLQLRTDN